MTGTYWRMAAFNSGKNDVSNHSFFARAVEFIQELFAFVIQK